MLHHDETIVAIATPPGRGAIAIVRLSGPEAFHIAQRHVARWPKGPRMATLSVVRDNNGTPVDQAVITLYAAPNSYTGDDVVEFATHGGLMAPTLVMAALIGSGARTALPGEFTRRAILNGKLDLVQAEAIGDLIDAGSRAMHVAAIQQLDGGLSQRINELREKILNLEALIAYDIDFPEEDDGPIARSRVSLSIHDVIGSLDALLATAPVGEVIRSGAVVVIAGPPNAGKSSLFNALLGANRAIVTDVPGTTRDAIEAVLDAGPWPIRLVDTAGLREASDTVERIGIEVSMRYVTSADVVLACGDTDASVEETVQAIQSLSHAPIIQVRTKSDRDSVGGSVPQSAPIAVLRSVERETIATAESSDSIAIPSCQVSAQTGEGMHALLDAINIVISEKYGQPKLDAPILTRERHRYAINAAREEMTAFEHVWLEEVIPPSIAAVHLRSATHALEEIVGAVDVEDILDRLFQAFCVGK